MPDYTCASCGSSFSLPQQVVDKYPGWMPRQCRSCRDGGADSAGASDTAAPRGGARRPRRRVGGVVEENLTIEQVLARYDGGPQDGVFTDGSAHPNPGPGGWGAVYVANGQVIAQSHGHEPRTTNNRMELTALIAGFGLVPDGTPATVYTDSRLCVDTITKWAPGWERQGWKRKGGEVQNLDLVKELYALSKARPEIDLAWIPAHAGNRWNEYADSLSTAYRRATL
ncbi:MAG TPA: ribonuclease H [Egibacteraceae bacterium]|nr:ribonuclease H [Egibacteraceae bacterium]